MIAIIPARINSKRLPGKNILPIGGVPMILRTIETAKASGLFSQIIVSTDSKKVTKIVGDKARIHMRRNPQYKDTVADVCLEVLNSHVDLSPQYFCCIYPQSVFITSDDLCRASLMLHNYDFVIGTQEYQHPWPLMQQEYRSDGLVMAPLLYESNGTLYFCHVDSFIYRKSFYGTRRAGYVCKNIDINTKEDYLAAQKLWDAKHAK